ncbi:uncharacterized protein LOC114272483 [Camellia sinensis]|uniref:uncharacterized protein LOC114272483 n=1 Tax=Camellia sinensis TaxID=4442 RepID=UPI001036141B|nr:uncharacterized protein LOC114272483 [Camellia sinensis]
MEHDETLANMARNTRQGQTNQRTGNNNRRGNVTNNGSGSQAVRGNQGQELGQHVTTQTRPHRFSVVIGKVWVVTQQEQAAIPNPVGMVQPGVGPKPRPRGNITEFKKIALAFDGATDPLEAEKWLTEMENFFLVFEYTDDQKERFKNAFNEKYFPRSVRLQKHREFSKLEQGNKTVAEYEAKFTKLSKFAPVFEADEDSRARKLKGGLRTNIMQQVVPFELPTFRAVLNKALLVEKGLTKVQEEKEENYKKRPSSSNFQTNNSLKGNAKRQTTSSVVSWGSRTVGGSVDKQNDRVQCTRCNGFHRDSECRWNTGACFSCGQQGHMIADCPN